MNASTRDAQDSKSLGLAADRAAFEGDLSSAWSSVRHALGLSVTRLVFAQALRSARRALRIADDGVVADDVHAIHRAIASAEDPGAFVDAFSQALGDQLATIAGASFVKRVRQSVRGPAAMPAINNGVVDGGPTARALLGVQDALADMDSVERALPNALAALDGVVAIRAAALLEREPDAARVSLFHHEPADAAFLLDLDSGTREAWARLALEPLARDVTVTHLPLPAVRTPARVAAVRNTTRATLHLPLVRGRHLIGLLRLDLESVPSDEDLALLATVASTLAVALAAPERASIVVDARTAAAEHAHRELLAVVSHDLRNPLSAILMSVSLMLRSQKHGDARENSKPVEVIKRSAERLNLLIQNVVDGAHLEEDGLQLALDRHPVAQVVADATRMLEVQAANRQIRLATDLAPDLGDLALDRERIVQTIANVLHATLRFTSKGGAVCVRARRTSPRSVRIEIQDSSPGFDAADTLRMFDRTWWSERNHSLGTGLGLAVARGIVQAHGGELLVSSTPGVGNIFSFELVDRDL
jgi:signal transduction histidine kinase